MLEPEELNNWLSEHVRAATTTAEALSFFDSLEAVPLEMMSGLWKGAELKTKHPLNGKLKNLGWFGKAFITSDRVHPLVFKGHNEKLFSLNTKFIPAGLMKIISTRNIESLKPLIKKSSQFLKTKQPTARLRMTHFRGVATTTMIYDFLPINDVFRKIDQDTVMGLMDMRDMEDPFFFILKRQKSPGVFLEELL